MHTVQNYRAKRLLPFGIVAFLLCLVSHTTLAADATAAAEERKAEGSHKIDSLGLLIFISLLVMTILTIWALKHLRLRWIHETGLAVIYGLIIGVMIRYIGKPEAVPDRYNITTYNRSLENDVYLQISDAVSLRMEDYVCHVKPQSSNSLESRASFDPEIFFYVILPPIIFHAGYSMKRRHFFRNFGAIMAFAFLGTIISAFTMGGVLYGLTRAIPNVVVQSFKFTDCLYYGAIISATDPVTVLAIFADLHVDVDLYAITFGESVLNDAIAIVLAGSVSNFAEKISGEDFNAATAVLTSIGDFVAIFLGSFVIGSVTGCVTAIMTKFTRLCDFPLLESSLFVLMSYISYLFAEAFAMSGIVAILFCGIFQAHYTFNNLSEESKRRTKDFSEFLNFVAENFVFIYIGISVFTREFVAMDWDISFIFSTLFAMTIARAVNIYPLSAILNIARKNKITPNLQHMMMFSGLRGAMAFALAIRHAASGTSKVNILLTTTIIMVITTVIGCGAFTLSMLQWLKIRVGVEEPSENSNISSQTPIVVQGQNPATTAADRARIVRWWNSFDNLIMKPILTNYRVTLADNFPQNRCCGLMSRLFSSKQQLLQTSSAQPTVDDDSDLDMIIDGDELAMNHNGPSMSGVYSVIPDPGDLGIGNLSSKASKLPRLELDI